MKAIFRPHRIALLLLLLASLTSCGGGSGAPTVALSNMVPVRLAMHLPGQTLAQADLMDKVLDLAIPDANAIVLAGAVSVTVTISGNGFTTIVDSFPAGAPGTQITKQYSVPQGASRTFSIQGFNTPVGTPAAVPILSGTKTVALAPSAAPVLVDVLLTPPSDTQPPVVTGPAPITVAAIDGTGTPKTNAAIAAFLAAATAIDNVDANPVVTNNAPLQFPLGPTTVTFTSTDAAGNTSIPVLAVVTVTDQSPPTIALNGANPLAVPQGSVFTDPGSVVTDNVSTGLAALVTGAVNTTVVGPYTLTYNVSDAAGNPATPVTRTVNVTATAAQSWQTLKTSGNTVAAATQFQSAMAANPADFEAVIGFCGTQTADLISNPAFRSLLTTWTTDAGASLPTAAALAMNVANRTKTTINWVKKFSQLAVNGATVQADGFSNVLPVLNTCITNLEGVLAAGFISQSVQNPAGWVRFPAGAVTVDVADVNLLLSILYGARSEIYWADAYNWNTDVDADGVVDTVITSAVIGATTYQYSTMNIDPKSVFADPTFFTLRTAGALLSTGASDLTQSLADAVAGATKRKVGLTTFNANAARAGNSANLFYYTPVNLANIPQDLTDTTNILAALDGTGYINPLFEQRDGTTATATIRADLAYTGATAWDRSVMPFASMAYDILPNPVASKMNNAPTYYDERVLGAPANPFNPIKVSSNIYYGTYPDVTMKGVLSGGATLDKQDKMSRPASSFVMNIGGVPILPFQSFTDLTGNHNVSWHLATDGGGMLALKVDQNFTMNNFAYTPYSVNMATGALSLPANVLGPVTLPGSLNGSGAILGNNAFFPGSSGASTGFWNLGIAALVPTVAPAGTFGSLNVLRSAGTATGLVHWYQGNFFNGAQFAAASQLSTGGTATVREQYGLGLSFNASPVGTDLTLGWLVFDYTKNRLMRVVTGATPQSAKVFYSPLFAGGGQGTYHLVAGKFLDSSNLPVVHSYPLPALASFPATGTVDVFP